MKELDWRKVRELFDRALECAPGERAALFDAACGDETDVRREVEALLEAHERPGDFLAAPPAGAGDTAERQRQTDSLLEAVLASEAAGWLAAGMVVDGKYQVEGTLGVGGMGAVFRARHLQLERPVALKVLRGELLADASAGERFRREAVTVARLRHPNIVTVYDYGVVRGSGAYLVMELLEGRSLHEELAARTRLDPPGALGVMAQTCAAVEAAHRAGVVHRDLKPENIFLERGDGTATVKVLDFGLAKLGEAVRPTGPGLTLRGLVLGTPAYMSPEQCRGEEADARSDVYALGCVLYEMLTGRPPFLGATVASVVYQHVHEEPKPPRELVGDLAPAKEEALLRALAKAPEDRHQTVEAFARSLGVWCNAAGPETVAQGGPMGGAAVATAAHEGAAARRAPARTNLPEALTCFVGRERQIADVRARLERGRLVTLTGPGGVGKSRLALEVAARLLGEYAEGVWLVEFEALADPELVVKTVASALGVHEESERSLVETLETWLRNKRVLLVLDNCEHLLDACARLTERLLKVCAGLRVLATSREALGVAGEVAWRVETLTVPSPEAGAREAMASEAVQLFIVRAAHGRSTFEVGEKSAPAIAALARRLEGIPLAIELAAARTKVLSVEQVLERLEDPLRLLAGGSRTAPSRQQTLRATLDWSYDLLTGEERAFLRRLSVFAGGWTLEAAEALTGPGGWGQGGGQERLASAPAPAETSRTEADAPRPAPNPQPLAPDGVLDLLSRLVDKSLVVVEDRKPERRFRMLETVREYAFQRQRACGEAEEVARRHAELFLELAEQAKAEFAGPRAAVWLGLLEAEHDNVRAALRWLLEHDPRECLRLAAALPQFWYFHGHFAEGRQWLRVALERSPSAPPLLRVKALRAAGEFAWRQGDRVSACAHLEQSLHTARAAGDAPQIAWSTFHLALAVLQQGDTQTTRAYLEESLTLGRALGDSLLIGNALNSLGELARLAGDWVAARPLYEQSLACHRQIGHQTGISLTLCNLGATVCEEGDLDAARSYYCEALATSLAIGNAVDTSLALDGVAAVAAKRGEWERSARLAGAAEALRAAVGSELESADRALHERSLAEAHRQLGAAGFEAALAEGRALTPEQAVAEALEESEG